MGWRMPLPSSPPSEVDHLRAVLAKIERDAERSQNAPIIEARATLTQISIDAQRALRG